MKLTMNKMIGLVLGVTIIVLAYIFVFGYDASTSVATEAILGDSAEAVSEAASKPDAGGSISWILVCSALVFLMVPGIALFYGGMLRKQSMSSMITQSLIAIGVMTIVWVAVAYSLAFAGHGTIIGSLENFFFEGLSEEAIDGKISDVEFATFQMMFAIVTAAIVLGACAERIKYTAMVWFLAIWAILVYAPMAHWVWGGGLFAQYLTVLDFAGGTVVHICAGVTGLALVAFAGSRSKRTKEARAHNIPFAFLGCMFLWIGWFGFNGGSGLAADGVAVHAVFVSQLSAACAMMAWAAVQYLTVGRVGVLGMISGGIAGLVAITPAAAYVGTWEAAVIGTVGGVACFYAVRLIRNKTKVDDALDVFAVHGVGGIWGAIATGIFADPALSGEVSGLIYGGSNLMVGQLVAVSITIVFCFSVSYAIIWILSKFMRVRVTEEEEMIGQDMVEHGESAYL